MVEDDSLFNSYFRAQKAVRNEVKSKLTTLHATFIAEFRLGGTVYTWMKDTQSCACYDRRAPHYSF